jgi:hypothetical protein
MTREERIQRQNEIAIRLTELKAMNDATMQSRSSEPKVVTDDPTARKEREDEMNRLRDELRTLSTVQTDD